MGCGSPKELHHRVLRQAFGFGIRGEFRDFGSEDSKSKSSSVALLEMIPEPTAMTYRRLVDWLTLPFSLG